MTTKKEEQMIIKKLEKLAVHNDPINPELYQKYEVKRGLRNANGTGVLVGLTRIGDVVGYEIKDGQKIAVPGRLIYRGYNVEDLVKDAEKNHQFGFEQCAYLAKKALCRDVAIRNQKSLYADLEGKMLDKIMIAKPLFPKLEKYFEIDDKVLSIKTDEYVREKNANFQTTINQQPK